MKKYLRLICDTCKRTADKLVDNSRATPDRCTITLACQGRLFPVQYLSDGQITSAPKVGITDWYPRGMTAKQGPTTTEPNLLDTSSGEYKQLVMGIRLASAPTAATSATLDLAARIDTPKEYKQYIYRRDNEFSTISGVEDGLSRKVLKFKAWGPDPDIVEVYLNGQKLEMGTGADQFQVDDGTPTTPAPSNTVKFNTPVLPIGTYQVDVIVSKQQVAPTSTLTFHSNEINRTNSNRDGKGAWENVERVDRFDGISWHSYYLFTCDIASNTTLKKDTILYPAGDVFVTGVGFQPIENAKFFLSRKPHSKIDRYPDISVPLETLGPDRDYLKYSNVDGALALQVTDTSLQTSFPPSRVIKFKVEGIIRTQVGGEDEQLVVDGVVIVGPDT